MSVSAATVREWWAFVTRATGVTEMGSKRTVPPGRRGRHCDGEFPRRLEEVRRDRHEGHHGDAGNSEQRQAPGDPEAVPPGHPRRKGSPGADPPRWIGWHRQRDKRR